jgi:hypothetical protein
MRGARAVIHVRRLERRELVAHGIAIEQIDGLPRGTGRFARRRTAGPVPCGDRDAIGRQEIEEVAAGEAGGSRDEDRRSAQRGIPFIPPLKGDTLPRPASVSEMKNW